MRGGGEYEMHIKKSFWTDPDGFSIVDALAIIYSSAFLILLIGYIQFPTDPLKEVIGQLSPLVYIILSGYFTGQAVQQFRAGGSSQTQYQAQPFVQPIMYPPPRMGEYPGVTPGIPPTNPIEPEMRPGDPGNPV